MQNNNNIYNYSETEKQLINNIDSYDMLDILHTYKDLSFEFVINYILNEKHQKTRKDRDITLNTVANYQPHLINKIMEIINSNNN
jgi:hypothetical protein